MKTVINLTACLAAVLCITFTSCKKETSDINATDSPEAVAATVTTTNDEAQSEESFDDVFNITASINAGEAGEDLGMGANVSGLFELGTRPDSLTQRCFTVTVIPKQPGIFPKIVTVDFGAGCLGRDGKYRKGKIISVFTNRMLIPGAKISTTFENYYVDSFKIEGTHITENTSSNNMQGLKIMVIEGKILNTTNGNWRKWNSTRNVLQIEGNGTIHFPLDDVYKITGTARGSNSFGHSWTSSVIEPLIKKFTCRWIVKGKVHLIRDMREATLDYGNGDCDNDAIIYINGIPHSIKL